jgi:hypothetical protein
LVGAVLVPQPDKANLAHGFTPCATKSSSEQHKQHPVQGKWSERLTGHLGGSVEQEQNHQGHQGAKHRRKNDAPIISA